MESKVGPFLYLYAFFDIQKKNKKQKGFRAYDLCKTTRKFLVIRLLIKVIQLDWAVAEW